MRAILRHCIAGAAFCCIASPGWGYDLLDAYRAALENDPNFKVAQSTLQAVRENIPIARAGLLPQISATTQRTENETVNRQRVLTGETFDRRSDYRGESGILQLRQPIYRRLNWVQLSLAEAQVAAAEAGFEKDRQDVGLRVSQAYFEVLLAQANVRVLQSQLDAFTAQQTLAERAFKAGSAARTDIDEARARALQTRAALTEASYALDNARRTLASLVGARPADLADVVPAKLELVPPRPAALEPWLQQMESGNPELASLRLQVEVAQQDVERQRAGHHPTLDLIAARQYGANETNVSINTSYYTSYIGVQATLPIFSGGGVVASVRQAQANKDKVRFQVDAARERLTVDTQRFFYGVGQGVEKVRALEAAAEAAEQALISTRKSVQAGTRTNVDVLNAVQRRAEAEQALNHARYEFMLNRLRLAAATGQLGEDLFVEVNSALAKP